MSEPSLDELKRYVDSLAPEQQNAHAQKAHAHDKSVFDLVKSGDRVGLYCAVKQNPTLLQQRDENNMTPLHHAGGDKSGMTHDILTEAPNNAPWIRDKFNRLPLDVMREAGQHQVANKVEPLTYPSQFKQIEDNLDKAMHLKAYEERYRTLERPDTMPAHMKGFKPKEMAQGFKQNQKGNERER
jgi:hypothetical protein